MSKKPPVAKKEEPPAAARQQRQKEQRQQQKKLKREKEKRSTKRKRESTQCTRLKATKSPEHAQLASGADQDTSWQITMTGTLAVTADSPGISRNKQF